MGCWVLSGVTLTMKGLLSVLLYRLSCSCAYPTRRVLTVPLQTNENISPKTLSQAKNANTSIHVACLTATQMGFIYNSSQTVKSSVKAALYSLREWRKCRDRHLSNMGENISRIWHTSLSVSLSPSSINTVIHWQGFDVAASFSPHLGCVPSQEK